MKNRTRWMLPLLLFSTTGLFAQKNYTEGPVMRVVHVRILPGKANDFWADINNNAKKLWEAEKAQGLIVDYRVFINQTFSGKDDWDVGYTIIFKDMASLDGFVAKFETLADQAAGGSEQRQQLIQKRTQNMEVVSSSLLRQVTLK